MVLIREKQNGSRNESGVAVSISGHVIMKFHQTFIPLLAWPVSLLIAHELDTVPWKTGRSVVDGLIEQLTPDEKVSLLHGSYDPNTESQGQNQAGYINPIPRLRIPQFRLSDGENGLNLVDDATGLPSQLNVAASFSRDVAFKHGSVAGLEAKTLGMGRLSAPVMTLAELTPFRYCPRSQVEHPPRRSEGCLLAKLL